MSVRHPASLLLLALLACVLAGGIWRLFDLRYNNGDIFPPYSTFRADPLGTRAYYDSLRALADLSVERNRRPLRDLAEGAGTTLFFLGVDQDDLDHFSPSESRSLETFLIDGGRLVLTLVPVADQKAFHAHRAAAGSVASSATLAAVPTPAAKSIRKAEAEDLARRKKDRDAAGKKDSLPSAQRPPEKEAADSEPEVSLAAQLDLELDFTPLSPNPASRKPQPAAVTRQAPDEGLPQTLNWHSGVYIRRMGPAWRAVYARAGKPVLIERPFGKGSLVLATDSCFASNEALRDERHSDLLAWLVGPSRAVIFDETHLNVTDDPSLVGLALKYRLHGVLAVLLILALLFVWQSATRLVPPAPEAGLEAGSDQTGRDAWAGLVELLERNIGRDRILRVCLAEWSHSRAGTPGASAQAGPLEEIVQRQEALPPRSRDPVEGYREISRQLSRRRKATP